MELELFDYARDNAVFGVGQPAGDGTANEDLSLGTYLVRTGAVVSASDPGYRAWVNARIPEAYKDSLRQVHGAAPNVISIAPSGLVNIPDQLLASNMAAKGFLGEWGESVKVGAVFVGAAVGAGAISGAIGGAAAGTASAGGAELAGTGASAFTDFGAWNTGFGNLAASEGAAAIGASAPTLGNVVSGLRTASTIANTAGSVAKAFAGAPATPIASQLVVAQPLVFGPTGAWPSLEPRSAAPMLDADQAQPFGTYTVAPAAEAEPKSMTGTVLASIAGAIVLGLVAFKGMA